MSNPVLNLQGPIGEVRKGLIYLLQPWNNFFQQFTQKASATQVATVGTSPFSYQPNQIGTVFIENGTVSLVRLLRGTRAFTMTSIRTTGILVSIGDVVEITYSVKPDVYFNELF